jgi:ubiquinone/menaquinone biosynthesis C-methylase UbiE
VKPNPGRVLLFAAAVVAGVALWWRKHPSACPYSQRFWVEAPHPLITRAKLAEILELEPGERVLEVGPGTGYYTPGLAERLGPQGAVEVLDVQQEMLDHTIRTVRERGLRNVSATQADARELPYDDDSFDAAVLVTVLGEVPNPDAALRELARVLRPGGRLVVGELVGDPHYVTLGSLRRRAEGAGLAFERRVGPKLGYFARFRS